MALRRNMNKKLRYSLKFKGFLQRFIACESGMDTDNSGTITIEELKQGLAKQGTRLSEQEIKQLMEAVSYLLEQL
uniref:Calcium-binding EF-hand n=1 Tax=Medicago truncatula TaxID=3880 RepID=Q2HSV4_MEDTR|nr:Calcium-binding EF-hand [Medicago truncatula]